MLIMKSTETANSGNFIGMKLEKENEDISVEAMNQQDIQIKCISLIYWSTPVTPQNWKIHNILHIRKVVIFFRLDKTKTISGINIGTFLDNIDSSLVYSSTFSRKWFDQYSMSYFFSFGFALNISNTYSNETKIFYCRPKKKQKNWKFI